MSGGFRSRWDGARRWFSDRTYLTSVFWAFGIITVANSVMMLTGWDTPKSGTFAYVHLLSRLGIITIVVAVIDFDDLRDDLRRRAERRTLRTTPRTDRSPASHALALLRRRVARAPADTAVATFTVVTATVSLVAVAVSPWWPLEGRIVVYQGLLVLATVLAAVAGASASVRALTSRGEIPEGDGVLVVAQSDGRRGPSMQYSGAGLALGAGIGVVVGVLISGWAIAAGTVVGAGVGLMIGAAIDAQHGDATQSSSTGATADDPDPRPTAGV